jgi:glycosyltransferase involved in cell wall biosynthesis
VAPDIILLAGLDSEAGGISAEQAVMYKLHMTGHRDIRIVLRVNENDARKGTTGVDEYLLKLSEYVDGTVFVSRWLQKYFEKKGWNCSNNTVIKNGVDSTIFAPANKFNDGKVHIAAHHWSDNPLKGADIYEEIDRFVGAQPKKFAFTYIGRHKCDFKHTTVVRPLYGKKLGEELGRHDVYVSASRFDPGPNHILESIACGLPTYVHKDGGGAVEFACGDEYVYQDWNELRFILEKGVFRPNPAATGDWKTCIEEYVRFMQATSLRTENP